MDDTFRRFYNLDSRLKTDRVSQIYLEGLHDRNYMATRFYNTQSLLFSDEPFSDATVFPIIDYDYIVKNPIVGGELSFNSNAMVFSNKDGVDSNRLIVESNWRRQMIDGIGEVFTPFAQLRGDIYGVGGVDNQGLNGSPDFVSETPDNGAILRGNALGGIEYRYPWMASTGSVTHVFEPIGQIIVRPNSLGNQQDIPNEDALSLVFDDTLLFDIDKFSGYDRIETGTRANVGMRYTAQLPSGTYARAVFGESYQLAGENEYDTDFFRSSGLATDRSDYVGGLYIQALSNLGFSAQSRFDEEYLGHPANRSRYLCALWAGASSGSTMPTSSANPGWPKTNHARKLSRPVSWRSPRIGRCSAISAMTSRPRRRSPMAWACAIRTTASCLTSPISGRSSKTRTSQPDQRFLVNFALKYLGTYQVATDATACSA